MKQLMRINEADKTILIDFATDTKFIYNNSLTVNIYRNGEEYSIISFMEKPDQNQLNAACERWLTNPTDDR